MARLTDTQRKWFKLYISEIMTKEKGDPIADVVNLIDADDKILMAKYQSFLADKAIEQKEYIERVSASSLTMQEQIKEVERELKGNS